MSRNELRSSASTAWSIRDISRGRAPFPSGKARGPGPSNLDVQRPIILVFGRFRRPRPQATLPASGLLAPPGPLLRELGGNAMSKRIRGWSLPAAAFLIAGLIAAIAGPSMGSVLRMRAIQGA